MRKPTWESQFQLWARRLLAGTAWKIAYVADTEIGAALARVHYNAKERTATFRYDPRYTPDNTTACHEVVHLLVARLYDVVDALAGDDPTAKKWAEAAGEETTEEIARAFLAAHGDE